MPAVSPSRLFCALSLLIALYVSSLHAAPYTFTKITDSTGPYNSFIDASINNSGSVALLGALDSGATGISRGNGGPLITIADTTGPFGGLFRPTINILGEVGFLASNDVGGSAVYRGDGATNVLIAATSSGGITGFGIPVVNDSGTVAFVSSLSSGGFQIASGNGLFSPQQLYNTTGVFSNFGNAELDFNNGGTVAFFANRSAGGFGIFSGSGGPATTIADSSTFSGFGTPAINNFGKVAFVGVRPTLPKGIFTGNGGAVTTYVDTSGPFSDFVVEMDINDTGTIAFLGLLDAGGGGVFTGPNPATDKMLVVGDTLFGSTITDLGLSFGAINNSGQISFVYTLANGVTGVAVATPVPEPALLWPLLIAASAIALRPSKRRPDSALS